jgi:D-threonate/D-erythronate kinase
MSNFLVLADDLSGAADCVAAFANKDSRPVIHLWPTLAGAVTAPAAIDLDTRRLMEDEASAVVQEAIRMHFSGRPLQLYKKVDSTLRGHIAAETAAALEALCRLNASGLSTQRNSDFENGIAVVAPSYPRLHRAIRDGRLILQGRPAEQTSIWSHECAPPIQGLPAALERVGLPTVSLDLAEIRAGPSEFSRRLVEAYASGRRAVVCDAETDDDLASIAKASIDAGCTALWVGSAGLAKALSAQRSRSPVALLQITGSIVTVVGSAAEVSRDQAKRLSSISGIALLTIPRLLSSDADLQSLADNFSRAVEVGRDVLLFLETALAGSLLDRSLASAAGHLLSLRASQIGAIVATGGDTARAVFDQLGVARLNVIGELEEGVIAGAAEGAWHGTAIIKAGTFGDEGTLARIHASLAAIRES